MKTFKETAAQGEIQIRRIDSLPKDLTPVEPENNIFIIGHSETGHHHVLDREGAQVLESRTAPAGMKILYGVLEEANELKHLRDFDTHESIGFQPGMYEFRLGREYDPYAELIRRVTD